MFLTPDDMITISNFYSVVCTFRLTRGHLHSAVSAGTFCFVCLFFCLLDIYEELENFKMFVTRL